MEKIGGAMREKILEWISGGNRLVGVGPMSQNCIEAIYSYSHDHACVIELIASRRQIEARKFGGGYVNNWSTEEFGAHLEKMKAKYPKSIVVVCRDHGGPWQGYNEEGLPFQEAMSRAKESFEADILAGFDLLHIDPSIDGDGNFELSRSITAACELLSHCSKFAAAHKRKILFEIGTEENVGKATSSEVFEHGLKHIMVYCRQEKIEPPLFVVGQTGSLVKEMRQVGNFHLGGTKTLVATASKYGVFLKEHNADYLSEYQLLQRDWARVPAINVAPEFGVIESRLFVDMCMSKGRYDLVERFIALSIASGKWKKWLVDKSKTSDYDIGMISGHYVFATPKFAEMKREIGEAEFDKAAKKAIYQRILEDEKMTEPNTDQEKPLNAGANISGIPLLPTSEKPWGTEVLLSSFPQYVMKSIRITAGHRTSLQYHHQKYETLVFVSGTGIVHYLNKDNQMAQVDIVPGMVVEFSPRTPHRVQATTELRYFEASTPEIPNDTVRIEDDYGR